MQPFVALVLKNGLRMALSESHPFPFMRYNDIFEQTLQLLQSWFEDEIQISLQKDRVTSIEKKIINLFFFNTAVVLISAADIL